MNDKRVLKVIPVPRVDAQQIRKIAIGSKDIRGVIISQKKRVEAEETLILNVYHVSGKIKKDISLSAISGLVKGTGIYDWLCIVISAQHYHQI